MRSHANSLGVDTYIFLNGDGKDTITDSDGLGKLVVGGVALTSGGDAHYYKEQQAALWVIHDGGAYFLNGHKQLTTWGAGNGTVVHDFDITYADGYLRIKLKRETKTIVAAAGKANRCRRNVPWLVMRWTTCKGLGATTKRLCQ
jgi:hypothetical protein